MKAICRSKDFKTQLRELPIPETVPEHIVIKVLACGINQGDKA